MRKPGGRTAMRTGLWIGLALATALVLSACSLNPPQPVPTTPLKDNWSELDERELSNSEIIEPEWWMGFGDPYLNQLIDQALDQNINLRLAALRLERASLFVRQAEGDRLPEVRLQPSQEGGVVGQGGQRDTFNNTELLGLSVSWELDLFGRLRAQRDVRQAEFKISEMDYRGVYLSSVSDVANLYFFIRQLDEQIANQQAAKSQGEQLTRIFEAQRTEGFVSETRVLSQRAEVSRLNTDLLERKRARRQAELELATALGQPSGATEVPPGALRESVRILPVPNVLPVDMIARRPDVLLAEYNVLRAYKVLGVARLRRLPTLNLSAVANAGNSIRSMFIDSWQLTYRVDGSGLFDRNVRRDIQVSEVDSRIAVEEYRRAVLNAVQDVEVRLNNLNTLQDQVVELDAQVDSLTVVRNVQRQQLREGLVSQLELFETQRQLLDAQQRVLDLYQATLVETVELYKALGGGWPSDRPEFAEGNDAVGR